MIVNNHFETAPVNFQKVRKAQRREHNGQKVRKAMDDRKRKGHYQLRCIPTG